MLTPDITKKNSYFERALSGKGAKLKRHGGKSDYLIKFLRNLACNDVIFLEFSGLDLIKAIAMHDVTQKVNDLYLSK